MMNWLVKWGVKRWLTGVVNNILDEYSTSVVSARHSVAVATAKIESVLKFLKSLDEKLADNKLTDGEIDDLIDEASELATALVTNPNVVED